MSIFSLPEPLRQLVTDELTGRERVRWVAQPIPRSTFPWTVLLPMFFAIPWTLFALFWMAGTAGVLDDEFRGFAQLEPEQLVFSLFGVPFVLIGLAMLSSPFWIRPRMRRAAARTAYVITDRRAIVFGGGYFGDRGLAGMLGGVIRNTGKGVNIRSFAPDQLKGVQRVQREDGSGDVIFGEASLASERRGQRQTTREGFFSIPDVKQVEELLNALAKSEKNVGS